MSIQSAHGATTESKIAERPLDARRDVGLVSLFSGAGGMDLGFKQAGFRVVTAIDQSTAAIRTHARNFARTNSLAADLVVLGPDGVSQVVQRCSSTGSHLGVIGGPPCQGFSRANTSASSSDPRNRLVGLYVDILSRLQDEYVLDFFVLENVLGLGDRRHSDLLDRLVERTTKLGFDVRLLELCALDFGVPQMRRRLILVGMRSSVGYGAVVPRKRAGIRTVRQAIAGLPSPAFFQRGLAEADIPFHANHWTMQPKSPRFRKPVQITDRPGRSFKVLRWDEPSPTVAYGHREIHVHPSGSRRLSIYEAMQLQGFPQSFVLCGNLSEQVEQISNAVPPPLARSVANAIALAMATPAPSA